MTLYNKNPLYPNKVTIKDAASLAEAVACDYVFVTITKSASNLLPVAVVG